MTDLDAARRRYVETIKKRERITSAPLLQALAAVPRERFLGPGPWRIRKGGGQAYRLTASADPIRLYDDVLVAIDARRRLDTGLPSLWAHLIDVLDVAEGARVVQIGCGLGYFTAILAEIAGPKGAVLALECDKELAARARANLRDYKNVDVVRADATRKIESRADFIIAHAGFSSPAPLWIKSLRPNGRLLLPLTGKDREGTVIRITRHGSVFEADAIRRIKIFPGQGRGTSALEARVTDWWERALALGPLTFRTIENGLPSDRAPGGGSR
ncbi:rRNA adenine N-6-methyltransferase family protein [Bradyrhizobium sp. Tv2a-2]|uniref:protein-L-isoaspartate O-methyltransferase family protein n=1 Tax=Bradyrhizobium sp. Tv2a-2 TaxID=113395 RepID=UPI000410F39E|nr:rRNA adenine N-6-methyltransferase family protein [Bradyrhizobium sp. Tv2a-2]